MGIMVYSFLSVMQDLYHQTAWCTWGSWGWGGGGGSWQNIYLEAQGLSNRLAKSPGPPSRKQQQALNTNYNRKQPRHFGKLIAS